MKDQYVGDINDYRKYALLRALADRGAIRVGICWMLTPADGRTDGRMTEYLRQPARWRHYDPGLFDLLASVIGEQGARRLISIESSGIVPQATYFNEVVPDDRTGRRAFFARAAERLRDCDLIFFDPDNGLDIPSLAKGRKNSSKFVYRDEIAATYAAGNSILIYQHFPREARSAFVPRIVGSLKPAAPGSSVWAFRTSNVLFLLLVHPAHRHALEAAAERVGHTLAGLFTGVDPLW